MSVIQKVVVCMNVERLREALDIPRDASDDDAEWIARQRLRELCAEFRRDGFDFDNGVLETDDDFDSWGDGRYGLRSRAHGYDALDIVAWRGISHLIIEGAIHRARAAAEWAKTEWARERIAWLEHCGRADEAQELRDRFGLNTEPRALRIAASE